VTRVIKTKIRVGLRVILEEKEEEGKRTILEIDLLLK